MVQFPVMGPIIALCGVIFGIDALLNHPTDMEHYAIAGGFVLAGLIYYAIEKFVDSLGKPKHVTVNNVLDRQDASIADDEFGGGVWQYGYETDNSDIYDIKHYEVEAVVARFRDNPRVTFVRRRLGSWIAISADEVGTT